MLDPSLVTIILKKTTLKKWLCHLIFVPLVFVIGFLIGQYFEKKEVIEFVSSFKSVRGGGDNYKYINPLIGTISRPATDVGIFSDIQSDLIKYIEEEKRVGNLYDISFYFRDLNSPLWFGVNEEKTFFPASLFKLPVAIALYRQAEKEQGTLDRYLIYTKELDDFNKNTAGTAASTLVIGRAYSVRELVRIMIEESDNGAKDLLLTILKQSSLIELFNIVSGKDPFKDKYEISSRTYAHFLRLLYGASYLNEEDSEYLLSLLAHADFKGGIVDGIPKTINVAHKYGVYQMQDVVGGTIENVAVLHDCGIIYHTGHPYIICIMTKGKDTDSLLKVLSSISKIVYIHQTEHDVDKLH